MPKKEPLLDNLKYLFCKDSSNGKSAGFDVQLMRDRLTEIRYDIDHMQSDLDKLLEKQEQLSTENEQLKARLDALENQNSSNKGAN